MKKIQKFTLEPEEPELEYDSLALLFFHTDTPGYVFANDLNHLYQLSLARKDDLCLRDARWPLYHYAAPLSKLSYIVIERPQGSGTPAPHWKTGHKLLIIKGDGADNRAQHIHDDFCTDPRGRLTLDEERLLILEAYQQELMPVSRLTQAEPLSKKAAKERAELESLILDLLDCLDFYNF